MIEEIKLFVFLGVIVSIILLAMRLILVPDPTNEQIDDLYLDDGSTDKEEIGQKNEKKSWKYINLLVILFLGLILQFLFLYISCHISKVNMRFAIVLDILILIRIGIARIINEKGKGWIFYAILAITSPILIDFLSWLRTGQ